MGSRTAYIEKGSPWKKGYIESFNAKLRDELIDRAIFYTLREAQILIDGWRRHYNGVRPHSSAGYRPPAPETVIWRLASVGGRSTGQPLALSHARTNNQTGSAIGALKARRHSGTATLKPLKRDSPKMQTST